MKWVVYLVILAAGAWLVGLASSAWAQGAGDVGNPDTLFDHLSRAPITYDTSYDRNLSSGTWTQNLSYGLTRQRVAFSANGNYTSVDQALPGVGGESGNFGGQLNLRATRYLTFGLIGSFNHVASHDLVLGKKSATGQRQNRLKINSAYSVNPFRRLALSGLIYTEFQQDHALAFRPLGQERKSTVIRYDAAGESVGVDTLFFHDHRDSTFMSGRQDGINAAVDWKPRTWLQWVSSASASRVRQNTTTLLRDFARTDKNSQVEVSSDSTSENPNNSESYQTKLTYTGKRGLLGWVNLRDLRNDQGFYDQSILHVENLSVKQRGALGHLEYTPFLGAQLSMDGKIESIFSQYRFRTGSTSYVLSRSMNSSFNYVPNARLHGGVALSVENRENLRQERGNGRTIFRFAQANGTFRASRRLGLDGTGSITLFSSQYLEAARDQDNVRSYVSVGGIYQVSERCSTFVHFSTTRSHTVAIAASRSGDNYVETTYQMDATLRLGLTTRISLLQNYVLSAIYHINDAEAADFRNILSRIKRIDTTLADSLFPFATLQVTHNFLFRDSGSYVRSEPGANRLYHIGYEDYDETLTATVNMRPAEGALVFVSQSLLNSRAYFPSTETRDTSNKWNLTVGATVNRNLDGSSSLQGTVQHVGAYTERRNPGDQSDERRDWYAGVTFHKDF